MDTIVLKFGGSSLSNNEKLKLVANKITDLYDKGHQIVVVLSAQGKTTDKLIYEAKQLSHTIDKRGDGFFTKQWRTNFDSKISDIIEIDGI